MGIQLASGMEAYLFVKVYRRIKYVRHLLCNMHKIHAVIIRCQPLIQPSNGSVTISSGTHEVILGRGATATYSCNTKYGLVGQATRTCVVTDGGTTGTWSGSQPTCHGVLVIRLNYVYDELVQNL